MLEEVQKEFPSAFKQNLGIGVAFCIWDECGIVFLGKGKTWDDAIQDYRKFLRSCNKALLADLKEATERVAKARAR